MSTEVRVTTTPEHRASITLENLVEGKWEVGGVVDIREGHQTTTHVHKTRRVVIEEVEITKE